MVPHSLKDGKAAGSNGTPAEFFKYSTKAFKESLTKALDIIFTFGTLPDHFNETLILPIFKKGDPNDPINYRGISFLNSALKIYTTLLYKRLNTWVNTNKKLSEFQAGFRSGYSTIDNIFVLTSIAQIKLNQNQKLYTFFVDFKAAFDKINRNAMFNKLYNLGLSSKFVHALEKLYQQTTANVIKGQERSEKLLINRGVKQGCNLSPLLFALFLDDIVDKLTCGIEI